MSDEEDVNEDDVDAEGVDGEDGDGEEQPKKSGRKKLLLFIVLPLVLVGIVAGVLLSGVLGGGDEEEVPDEIAESEDGEALAPAEEEEPEAPDIPRETVFYDLPEMLVNLNTSGRQASFLKIQVSLELGTPEAVPEVEKVLPRIIDNFQVYLRELRPDELSGTKGVFRLKEELLVRVNAAVQPVRVYDILFKEILVQG